MNTLETPKLFDAYDERRREVHKDQNSLEFIQKQLSPAPPAPPAANLPPSDPLNPANAPSQAAIKEEEDFSFLSEAGKTLEWLMGPIIGIGEAGLAPIAHEYEADTLGGKAAEALEVSGKAFLQRALPEYGMETEEYSGTIIERTMPNAHPVAKGLAKGTLDVVSDPSIALGLPAAKVIQKGLRLANTLGKSDSFKGIFQEGLHEILTVGKGVDANDLSTIGRLAELADSGDPNAIKELNKQLDSNPAVRKAVQSTNDADVQGELSKYTEKIGDVNAPTFTVDPNVVPDDLIKNSLKSNSTGRAGNINLANLNTPEDVDNLLINAQEIYAEDFANAAGKQTNAQTIEMAKDQNAQLSDLMGRKAATFTAEESYTLRQLLVTSGNQLNVLAKKAAISTDKLDALAFDKGLAVHRSIQAKAAGVSAHAGRLLQSYNIVAKEGRGKLKEINELISGVGTNRHSKKIMQQLLSAVDDPMAINRMIAKTPWEKGTDAGYEIFVNSILSGPITHAVNISSNALMASVAPAEDLLKGMSAAARMDFTTASQNAGQFTAKMHAILQTTGDAAITVATFGKRKFDSPEELTQMHEIAKQQLKPAVSSEALGATGKMGTVIDAIGTVVRLPGNALLAEDKFFKTMHYRMQVNSDAATKALSVGGGPKDTRAVYNAMRGNPDESSTANAIDKAAYYTFTSELGDTATPVHKAIMSTPGLRYLMPFFRTPTNIVKVGVRHSVFGNVFRDLKPALSDMTPTGDMARAKIAMGTAIPATIFSLLDDNITGSIDQSTPTGQFQAQQGKPAYSIKIGDKWISYEKMEPLRTVLGLFVNSREALRNIDQVNPETGEPTDMVDAVTNAVIGATTSTVFDNYMVPFLGDIVSMAQGLMSGNTEFAAKKFQKLAASATVPNGIRQLNQAYWDNTYRKADNYIEMVKQGIPGLSKSLPARQTVYGEDVHVPEGLGIDIISPLRTTSRDIDPIDDEVIRLGVRIPGQPEKIPVQGMGISLDLDPFQQETFSKMRGQGMEGYPSIKEQLKFVMESPQFQHLPDEMKRVNVQYVFDQATLMTHQYMLYSDPNLQFQLKQKMEDKQKAERLLK